VEQTPATSYVNALVVRNQSQNGNPSFSRLRYFVQYLQQGSRLEPDLGGEARGNWYGNGENGQLYAYHYPDVVTWARENSHEHPYTYQLLLSTRDGQLTPHHFYQTMQAGSQAWDMGEYRFIVHEDTAHQHAHALFFSDRRLPKALFLEGQQAMQESLAQAVKRQQQEAELEATRQRQLEEQRNQQAQQVTQRSRQLGRSRGLDL